DVCSSDLGNAPAWACLQGRCITFLPRPLDKFDKLASRPGAAPGRLSFGDSAAQAGARLLNAEFGMRGGEFRGRCLDPLKQALIPRSAIFTPKSIGAVAGNRTRTCYLAGSHSTFKSQPRN